MWRRVCGGEVKKRLDQKTEDKEIVLAGFELGLSI